LEKRGVGGVGVQKDDDDRKKGEGAKTSDIKVEKEGAARIC